MLPLNNKDIQATATARPSTGRPTGFVENFKADLRVTQNEERVVSENNIFTEIYNTQADALREAGFGSLVPENKPDGIVLVDPAGFRKQQAELGDIVSKANHEHGLDIPTTDKLLNDIVSRIGADRKTRDDIASRATGKGKAGSFAGTAAGVMSDPVVAISSLWGANASHGVLRTMLIEAGIGSSIEAAIQPQIFDLKKQIDSPYSVSEALMNVAGAGVGAAGIAGTFKSIAKIPAGGRDLLETYKAKKAAGKLARKPGVMEDAAENFLERHVAESEANPFDPTNPASAKAHADNLTTAVKRIDNGEPIRPDDLHEPVPRETIERRVNRAERKRVDDMSGAERKKALLTDDLTGLQNRRAFDEHMHANPDDDILFGDLDDFKGLNTDYGHAEVDDVLLPVIGKIKQQVADETGIKVFRRTGDEFLAAGPAKKLQNYAASVQKRLQRVIIELQTPEGRIVKHEGVGYSYGIERTERNAEIKANTQKAQRKAAGLRKGTRDTDAATQQRAQDSASAYADGQKRARLAAKEIDAQAERLDKQPDLLDDQLNADTARILEENPELSIPVDEVVDPATGRRSASTITARELLQAADEEANAAKIFTECATGMVEAAA